MQAYRWIIDSRVRQILLFFPKFDKDFCALLSYCNLKDSNSTDLRSRQHQAQGYDNFFNERSTSFESGIDFITALID